MNDQALPKGSSPTPHARPWLSSVAALLAFLSCNGAIILLSLFGVTLAVSPHAQAAVISAFTILTLVLVAIDWRKHGRRGPFVVALLGALVVVGSMYVVFYKVVETVGLLALIAAAVWNWRLMACEAKS